MCMLPRAQTQLDAVGTGYHCDMPGSSDAARLTKSRTVMYSTSTIAPLWEKVLPIGELGEGRQGDDGEGGEGEEFDPCSCSTAPKDPDDLEPSLAKKHYSVHHLLPYLRRQRECRLDPAHRRFSFRSDYVPAVYRNTTSRTSSITQEGGVLVDNRLAKVFVEMLSRSMRLY